MASQQPSNRDLASRLNTIEEELADTPMSEEAMEAAFDRLDASLDAAR